MTEHYCPQNILTYFDGNEELKMIGRGKVIEWLKSLNLLSGDIAYIPEANSTEFMKWEYKPELKIQ